MHRLLTADDDVRRHRERVAYRYGGLVLLVLCHAGRLVRMG